MPLMWNTSMHIITCIYTISKFFAMDIMKRENLALVLYYLLLVSTGFEVYAQGQDYDYSYTAECLKNPLKPQYEGGIVVNPELNDGLNGWTILGDAKIENVVSSDGNNFIVASQRKGPYHGLSQKFQLEKDKNYVVSGWLQVNHGDDANVAVIFKTQSGFQHAAWGIAKSGCWSMFKGGLTVNASGPAQLYFETNDAAVDIWVDSISVQPFSQEEWTSHQNQAIEKVRKSKVAIQVVDSQGKPLPNATISLIQGRANFPFGVAINKNILNNNAYQNWFFSRFKFTVFEDEMKWYSTEVSQGKIDYSTCDAMVNLCKSKGVSIRGQSILWDDQKFQPNWVPSLSPQQLSAAAGKRVDSVVTKYRGQVIHWDVMNENIHFNFFESKLGANASATYFRLTSDFDKKTPLFLNEYNTIEVPEDGVSSPANYLNKIKQLRAGGYGGSLGIGLEGHFAAPNQAYIRSGLDTMASARLPIWITEVDVRPNQNQAQVLDQVIKEVVAHPAVQGVIIWSAWKPTGCFRMCLTDNNFKNLPTGDVVDKIRVTMSHEGLVGTTNAEGYFETSLFHGDYKAIVAHPSMADSSFHHDLTVMPIAESDEKLSLSYKFTAA
ncbi:endo-1,4-beta-xylanase 5-like [Capsicum chacoense]